MADSFKEVTRQSWFGRIGNSIKGILFGIALVIIAVPVLFWNEGRSVKTYRALKEGAGAVVSVPADSVDASNDGKLVHITGMADIEDNLVESEDYLHDDTFGVLTTAIKMRRKVQMYQWMESKQTKTKKNTGGSTTTETTYSYSKVWSDNAINSGSFKEPGNHNNPTMQYSSKTFTAQNVNLGAFALSSSLINKINAYTKMNLTKLAENLPTELASRIKLYDGGFYIGDNPSDPKIGDMKVIFESVQPQEVSIVSQQNGNSFVPYQSTNGKSVELLQVGKVSADAMFEAAQKQNAVITWIFRAVGFLMMFIGFACVFKPLSVVADVLPFLGNLVGMGVTLISFLLAVVLASAVIAVAWIVVRPVLGVSLLVITVVSIGGIVMFRKKQVPVNS